MGLLDKIFANTAKKMQKDAIKKLSKEDKDFADGYDKLVELRGKVEKDLKAKGVDINDRGREILKNLK